MIFDIWNLDYQNENADVDEEEDVDVDVVCIGIDFILEESTGHDTSFAV